MIYVHVTWLIPIISVFQITFMKPQLKIENNTNMELNVQCEMMAIRLLPREKGTFENLLGKIYKIEIKYGENRRHVNVNTKQKWSLKIKRRDKELIVEDKSVGQITVHKTWFLSFHPSWFYIVDAIPVTLLLTVMCTCILHGYEEVGLIVLCFEIPWSSTLYMHVSFCCLQVQWELSTTGHRPGQHMKFQSYSNSKYAIYDNNTIKRR